MNKKQLKNYIHLYPNVECVTPIGDLYLTYVNQLSKYKAWFTIENKENEKLLREYGVVGRSFWMGQIKPKLRRLSDMSNEECHKYGIESDGGEWLYGSISSDCSVGGHHHILEITRIAEIVKELCKDEFDCFELIEAGLAIDKNTLQNA